MTVAAGRRFRFRRRMGCATRPRRPRLPWSSRSPTSPTIDSRSLSAANAGGADHRAEMLLEPLVAFTRAALQGGAIGDLYAAASGGGQPFGREVLHHCIDRRALNSE